MSTGQSTCAYCGFEIAQGEPRRAVKKTIVRRHFGSGRVANEREVFNGYAHSDCTLVPERIAAYREYRRQDYQSEGDVRTPERVEQLVSRFDRAPLDFDARAFLAAARAKCAHPEHKETRHEQSYI